MCISAKSAASHAGGNNLVSRHGAGLSISTKCPLPSPNDRGHAIVVRDGETNPAMSFPQHVAQRWAPWPRSISYAERQDTRQIGGTG